MNPKTITKSPEETRLERQRAQATRAREAKVKKQAEWQKSQGELSNDGDDNRVSTKPAKSQVEEKSKMKNHN